MAEAAEVTVRAGLQEEHVHLMVRHPQLEVGKEIVESTAAENTVGVKLLSPASSGWKAIQGLTIAALQAAKEA